MIRTLAVWSSWPRRPVKRFRGRRAVVHEIMTRKRAPVPSPGAVKAFRIVAPDVTPPGLLGGLTWYPGRGTASFMPLAFGTVPGLRV
jgi:hypothetical protein